ncbi:MAG: hypothetical protein PHS95_02845 [Candidatus Pacebacteria bacterium]|nr:hypothetical protein [Candidatus Paceibacterota bacterium]
MSPRGPIEILDIIGWREKIRACRYPSRAERVFKQIPKDDENRPIAFPRWAYLCDGNLKAMRKICELIETEEKFKKIGMHKWSKVALQGEWGAPTWEVFSQHLQETLAFMESDQD